jgi:ABC-type xylose transport system permease subunit
VEQNSTEGEGGRKQRGEMAPSSMAVERGVHVFLSLSSCACVRVCVCVCVCVSHVVSRRCCAWQVLCLSPRAVLSRRARAARCACGVRGTIAASRHCAVDRLRHSPNGAVSASWTVDAAGAAAASRAVATDSRGTGHRLRTIARAVIAGWGASDPSGSGGEDRSWAVVARGARAGRRRGAPPHTV